jgi:purine catabolism regulator
MLTVQSLVEEMGLELVSGDEAAGTPVRWVHITELPDPTPWLSGGELILTTGLQLAEEADQRAFVRRLVEHHLAGLGFATGLNHDALPEPMVDEARKAGFPLFEVPYRMPFIAITEKAFTRLVNEQYEVLQRSLAAQKRLERLVLEERGLAEIVRALATTIGGSVLVLDARGEVTAGAAFRREFPAAALAAVQTTVVERSGDPGATAFSPDHPEVAGRAHALPVALHSRGGPTAWLVAARDAGGLGDFERLILQQAATVVALELMRQRTMRDTERRLARDILAEAVEGRLDPGDLSARLRPFGLDGEAAALVFALDEPRQAEADLDRALADDGIGALVATRDNLLCAVVDCSRHEPVELARDLRSRLLERHGGVRAAASRPAPVEAIRRSFHEARCALEAAAIANGSAPEVASYRDLGAFNLLLSLQDEDALRLYCDSVLGPLEEGEGEYGEELVRSLEAFIEQNGQWERAARQLYCHRHTLRYRIRRIEQLTGRDLGNARDRIEFWLALRARELVS